MKLSRHFEILNRHSLLGLFSLAATLLVTIHICAPAVIAQDSAPNSAGLRAPEAKTAAPLGTIKSISGNSLVLASDTGAEVNVEVRESTKIVRIAPGQTDLKDAQSITWTDLQVGDRILVRGKAAADGKTFSASSIIAMKKTDIADKQTREREQWQKSGVGGLVNNVNAASGIVSITVPSLREKKTVAVHIAPQTTLRRYAPGSVKFDDAKPAPLGDIRPGDQLRARGEKSTDGSELTAAEVVSGSFRNISGTISSLDSAQGTITVHDLATKKTVTVKISSESQLRKLPAPIAQRIAERLNGMGANANGEQSSTTGPPSASASTAPAAKDPAPGTGPATPSGMPAAGRLGDSNGPARGMAPGAGGVGAAGGAMDLQQMISRMPASTIADLEKGDAVMLVGTAGNADSVIAITLLAGVEPILQASPNGGPSTILSPWSLSGAPGGEGAP